MTAPQNNFKGKVHEWEMRVFLNADKFSVCGFPHDGMGNRFNNMEHTDHYTWPDTMEKAKKFKRALVYALTDDGRTACLERKHWPSYDEAWPKAKLNGGPGK